MSPDAAAALIRGCEAAAAAINRPRRTVTNTEGRFTVPGWSEFTSDRVLAEYVAAELDRVDPL